MKWALTVVGIAFVAVLVMLAAPRPVQQNAEQWVVKTGMEAPDFRVVDARGDSLRLSDLRGRFVLLDFWFTTCPPCLEELPRLKRLRMRYDEQLVVVGVSTDGDPRRFDAFLQRESIDWHQVLDYAQNAGAVHALYRVPYYPSYFLVDPEGRVAAHGRFVLEQLERQGLQYEYDG